MEKQIASIVKHIRTMANAQKNRDIQELAQCAPTIRCSFENEKVVVQNFIFENDFDKLIVSRECFVYKPEFGQKQILHRYNGWDELLTL